MQLETPGPSPQKVAAAPLQLSRAGAAKHERQPFLLDQAMNLIQQCGDLLHLVDDDGTRPDIRRKRRQAFAEPPGRSGEFKQQPRIEQVETGRIRELGTQQGRFADLARSPEKRRLPRWQRQAQQTLIVRHSGPSSELVKLIRNVIRNSPARKRSVQVTSSSRRSITESTSRMFCPRFSSRGPSLTEYSAADRPLRPVLATL